MSIRALISFDVQKNERYYHVMVPNGAPYQEAREAILEVIERIDNQEKLSKEIDKTASEIAGSEVDPESLPEESAISEA